MQVMVGYCTRRRLLTCFLLRASTAEHGPPSSSNTIDDNHHMCGRILLLLLAWAWPRKRAGAMDDGREDRDLISFLAVDRTKEREEPPARLRRRPPIDHPRTHACCVDSRMRRERRAAGRVEEAPGYETHRPADPNLSSQHLGEKWGGP